MTKDATPPLGKGFVVWFAGLSGSGKTTIAKLVEEKLKARGINSERLDGDIVRQSLTRDLAFCKEDRDKNIQRVPFVLDLMGASIPDDMQGSAIEQGVV